MNDYLERIQQGVDHIEARLEQRITLARVARAAGMSQWHFQRIFRSLTGDTLKGYIRARRLANALERLRDTDQRVLDVAVSAGFESQESFARAFKKAYGLSPTAYRAVGSGGRFLKKLQLDEAYLRHLHGQVSRSPVIRHQPELHLVGLHTRFFGVDSDKNNVGRELPALWAAFLPRLGEVGHAVPGVCYGVVRQERVDTDRLEYFAAIAVHGTGPTPPGMTTVVVPEATLAEFRHQGPAADVDRTVSYAYGTWLPQSAYHHTGGPDLEVYGAEYHPTSDRSVLHYALPIG